MKIKELQQQLDYLVKCVEENPNKSLYYTLIRVKNFTMNFEYFYNELYGINEIRVRFYNLLDNCTTWHDYKLIDMSRLDAYIIYSTFISFTENSIIEYSDNILKRLRSGAVELNRSEIK